MQVALQSDPKSTWSGLADRDLNLSNNLILFISSKTVQTDKRLKEIFTS